MAENQDIQNPKAPQPEAPEAAQAPNPETPETPAPKKRGHKALRITLKVLMWLIIVVLLIPVLLYIPPVQTFVKNIACDVVYKSTGMKVQVDRFRLKWPVDVSLQGVTVVEATGDTMVNAKEVIANVQLLPLMHLDVKVNELMLLDGYYRMVSPDSSMILKLNAGSLTVDSHSSADIANSRILLHKAVLKNGNVSLYMDPSRQQPSDSTASAPFYIAADDLQLENFGFEMSMRPTIDTLRLFTNNLRLLKGVVDLGKNRVTASSINVADGDVTYLTPPVTDSIAAQTPAPADTTSQSPSAPMVIQADTITLSGFKALYAVKDAKPLPGFDPSYIEVSDIAVTLANFYNEASTVRLPITKITAKERSGLYLTEGSGLIAVDSTGLSLDHLHIATPYTSADATAGIPFALMALQPTAPLDVTAKGHIGLPDVEAFMPTLKTYLGKLPSRVPVNFALKAKGNLSDVEIPEFNVAMPGIFALKADGKARNPLDYKKLRATLDFDGSVTNPAVIDNLLGDAGFKIPSLVLKGKASAVEQSYGADFSLLTSAGDLTADGKVSMTSEHYNAHLSLHNVNVAHFMPTAGVGLVTATLQAEGAGFNPTLPHADTDIRLDVTSLVYQKKTLRDIVADVTLNDGAYTINAVSANKDADFHIEGAGTLAPDLYTFDLTGHLKYVDLQALGLSPDPNGGKGDLHIKGSASPEKWTYNVDADLNDVEWTIGNEDFSFPGAVSATFRSDPLNVAARVEARLATVDFSSTRGLQSLINSFTVVGDTVSSQLKRRRINIATLQKALPPFNLAFNASGRGLVGQLLNTSGLSVDTIYATVANDSLITADIGAVEIANQSMRADTLTLGIKQRGSLLDYKAHMGNRPNNPLAEFADVNLNGYLGDNRALISLTQRNQKGDTGYRIGFTASLADSIATVHFTPLKATIAYLPWTFNNDNHVEYNFANRHIDANLLAESSESSIHLLSQIGKAGNDELNVDIKNLKVQDFLRMSVFAPPITASLNANLNIGYTNNWLYGGGSVAVSDFTYDKLRVGDFDLGLRAGLNDDGSSGALATLKIDGQDALTAKAKLVPDSATNELIPEKLGLELTRFPLYVANAFLGNDVARLSGYLNGDMDMSGSFSAPVFNGAIACDSVGVYVPMLGSQLTFGNDSVSVASNVVRLNNFDIWGANKNPLVVNGSVDATKFSNILFDLGVTAQNFQLMGNTSKAKSEIYGKLFLDLNANATGPMNHFSVNANLNILSNSDVTYSVSSATATQLTQRDATGVVKFVNFNDTTQIAKTDTVAPIMSMRIVAGLTIQPGVQVTVDIPGTATTGNGKVELSPSGELSYFQNYMGDMRLNGQIYTGNGYAKYNVPVIGEKKFTFNPQSSVTFSGDIMNPSFDISATDEVKTNIIDNGNSRLVNFLIGLKVTNNLSAPKVTFDLSTDDDMSIQNDLLSMSADQRSTAAMNLLLTGQYNASGVKTASSDMMTGALYGMLTSQLNSFLANHVKGVDLSFGVDQYDKTVNGQTGSTTSYSYQMSKSLFDNRFKISVGGNYSTDASADENFSENLISDISFEYILKQTSDVTMYARLFRHTGYESILEGEITETGVGFVMKRRLADLRHLFRWRTKPPVIPDSTINQPAITPKNEEENDSIEK